MSKSDKNGWKDQPHAKRSRVIKAGQIPVYKFFRVKWVRYSTYVVDSASDRVGRPSSVIWATEKVCLDWLAPSHGSFTNEGAEAMADCHGMRGWAPFICPHQGK